MRRALLVGVALAGSACFLDAVGLPPEPASAGGSADPESGGAPPEGGSSPGPPEPSGGEGGAPSVCGNGIVETEEGCDSGAPIAACMDCQITPGFTCAGEPSLCSTIEPVAVNASFDLPITDLANHYDGSVESMDCADIVMADTGFDDIQWVTLEVAVDHGWLGDLVIKLVPPAGMPVATVLSRAAVAEGVDDYIDLTSEGSAIRPGSPVTFDDTAAVDAEELGATIVGGVVCQDDLVCDVRSNPGAAVGEGLVDLVGASPAGTWRVCFADADDGVAGSAKGARLTVLAW